jgi:O-methyltransferase
MTSFTESLLERTLESVAERNPQRIALIGATSAALGVRARLHATGLSDRLLGIFHPGLGQADSFARALSELAEREPDLLVICADTEKEELLLAARDALTGLAPPPPEVVVAGAGHLDFHDPLFAELDAPALVPSYATGSPHTRIHLFQCLRAAAANGLRGAIVEFGAFKGGTTAWLARTASRLGLESKVVGFDTWEGFPERRSLLDLYRHPRCVFTDLDAVRAYTEPYGIELVPGDISETYKRLKGEPLILCFFDTDNYSPTRAALELCLEQLIPGGALVFDHVATTVEYMETVGERIAAYEVLADRGLLHLHGTGVFVRLR